MDPKERKEFNFEMLIGALRYYENRMTAASASFPGDVIKYYFTGDNVDEEFCKRVAYQFAFTDHKSEADWADSEFDCDREVWTRFFQFCRGYINGFTKIECTDKKRNKFIYHAFKVDYENLYYDVDSYLSNPQFPPYIDPEYITKIFDNGENANEN